MDLMLDDHQGYDVAVPRQVRIRVEQSGEVRTVAVGRLTGRSWIVGRSDDDVACVALITVGARHVPSTPPTTQGRLIRGQHPALVTRHLSPRVRGTGPDQKAGDTTSAETVGVMAPEAKLRVALEVRCVALLLAKRIEDRPEVRVEGRDLQKIAPLQPCDIDIVPEVDGPRCVRRYEARLEARCRENQHLRRGGHVEQGEERGEVSAARLIAQLCLASRESMRCSSATRSVGFRLA